MKPAKIDLQKINFNLKNSCAKFIDECETNYKRQINEIANIVLNNKKIKFLLLAGPSGSGKTTTCKLLCELLNANGETALPISLDDFFVERLETPKWDDDGSPNFETVDSIDWTMFDKCMYSLLRGEAVQLPIFNFITGKKQFDKFTVLNKNSVVIIEGLHALNPIVDNFIPRKKCFKTYITTYTDIIDNDQVILPHFDVRLCRRLIRDLYTRAKSVSDTMESWVKVRKGESLYITPYKCNAEYFINSFHGYELNIYKKILIQLKDERGLKVDDFIDALRGFDLLDKSVVPCGSVLQEFVH